MTNILVPGKNCKCCEMIYFSLTWPLEYRKLRLIFSCATNVILAIGRGTITIALTPAVAPDQGSQSICVAK